MICKNSKNVTVELCQFLRCRVRKKCSSMLNTLRFFSRLRLELGIIEQSQNQFRFTKVAKTLGVIFGILSFEVYAQVDDFSLNADIGNNASNSDIDSNDIEDDTSLFENEALDFPLEDNKSKLVKEPSPTIPAKEIPPVNAAGKSKSILNPASPAPPTPVTAATPATPPVIANPAVAPAVSQPTATTTNVPPPAVSAEAPLAGDGSLAPVKTNQKFGPNDFGGVPPLPGTRKQLAVGEAPELYNVEEGDTMFDVCSQLIDDGNYWPKLWSLNPDVKNPHFIYPGMQLAFYSGDQDTPPFLEVVTEDDVVPVDKGEVKEAELVAEEVPVGGTIGRSDIPITEPPSKIVSGGIEDTAPTQIIGPGEIGAEGDALDGFIFGAKAEIPDRLQFVVPAFIFEEEKEVLGTVIGGASGQSLTGDDAKAFIEAGEGLGMGTYTVLRPNGSIKGYATGDTVGLRYEFVGNIRIFRQTKNGFFEGVVFDSRWGARSGDILVSFLATRRAVDNISSIGPVATAPSSVIGFSSLGQGNGGKGDLVFLEKQGLSVGAYYAVFQNDGVRELRHQREPDLDNESGSIATIRVVDFVGNSALGVIVGGNAEVKIGDALSIQ